MITLTVATIYLTLVAPTDLTPTPERIRPEDVNYRNYETFVEEIRSDLPVGTPKAEVQSYLASRGIGFSAGWDEDFRVKPPSVEHYVVFLIRRIRNAFIFGYTDLRVSIYLSEDGRVSRIVSKTIETAP